MSVTAWPSSLRPTRVDLSLQTNTQTFTSALDGSDQMAVLPGARWVATVTFPRLRGASARALRAFLAALAGPAGRFYLPVFDQPAAAGSASGSGVVSGAGQTGSSLVTSGWTASQTGLLLAGDYIQVGNALHMVTADVDSDGSGAATLSIAPPLRTSPADLAPIVTASPACVMALADDQQAAWAVQSPDIYAFTLACREPLDR